MRQRTQAGGRHMSGGVSTRARCELSACGAPCLLSLLRPPGLGKPPRPLVPALDWLSPRRSWALHQWRPAQVSVLHRVASPLTSICRRRTSCCSLLTGWTRCCISNSSKGQRSLPQLRQVVAAPNDGQRQLGLLYRWDLACHRVECAAGTRLRRQARMCCRRLHRLHRRSAPLPLLSARLLQLCRQWCMVTLRILRLLLPP